MCVDIVHFAIIKCCLGLKINEINIFWSMHRVVEMYESISKCLDVFEPCLPFSFSLKRSLFREIDLLVSFRLSEATHTRTYLFVIRYLIIFNDSDASYMRTIVLAKSETKLHKYYKLENAFVRHKSRT